MNDLNSQAESLGKFVEQLGKSGMVPADALTPEIFKIDKSAADYGQQMRDLFYEEYLKQGAIYGESDEGFLHWFYDIGRISWHESKARELRERQQLLRTFK